MEVNVLNLEKIRSPRCNTTGAVVSWEGWEAGSIPGLAQWVGDPVLLQLWLRSHLRLTSDPWPRNSMHHGVAKTKRKKEEKHHL